MGTGHSARRVWKVALGVVAVALVLLVGALALKPSWIAERLRGQVEAIGTRSLGRPVTLQELEAHWLPRPGATLTNLRVEGEGNEPPFLEAPRATVTVQLWPLIRSLGRDVRVGAMELDDTKLNLVRREDGTWNYESFESTRPESERDTFVEELRIRNGVVNVTDLRAAGGTAAVALRDIDATLKNLGPGMALEGEMKAAFAAPAQNVTMDFKVDPFPIGKPQPGQPWPEVTMHLRGKDLSVRAFRNFLPPKATGFFTGGLVDLDADVKTGHGRYALAGRGSARELKLRGDSASGSFEFNSNIDPANVKAAKVDFTRVALEGPGIDLGGTASAQLAPTRVRFALQGQELDLKHLLSALPPQPEGEDSSTGLPASVRAQLGKVEVGGTLELAKLRHGALVATDVEAQAKLDDGVLLVQRGGARVYGGHVDISGTRVDLTQARPVWLLKAVLAGMDTAQAFQALSGHQPLRGLASGELQLNGAGSDWAEARSRVTGGGHVRLRDGVLTTADLGAEVAPVLGQGLAMLGYRGAAGTVQKAGEGTRLKDLNARFRVQDGWVEFTQPMAFQSDIGAGTLDGRVGLDQRLELEGTFKASEQFVSAITHGAIAVKAPVTLPLTITGTLNAPEVKPGSPMDIAKGLSPAVPGPKSLENPVNQARKGLGDLFRRPRK
ncbi:AsmA-like C-terminal region-containing protein [Myxococcus sp. RHSTA-1-4]|uniref:AsmA family protein n=1 Tax=Myxococcus sp. RHSTA-1-4 TaxID=2874601 RepID=UPI001CBAB1D1|nr:AsmA-like C-terminal region-containing protein [Myxococcus sp. RHSTA-1-4]MBZ4419118.1 AsmA family protein [Myxococcus sp. RHSTA-1-4]